MKNLFEARRKKDKLNFVTCKNCGELIDSIEKVGYAQTGEITYFVYRTGNELGFDQREIYSDDMGIFYCLSCGHELFYDYDEGYEYCLSL